MINGVNLIDGLDMLAAGVVGRRRRGVRRGHSTVRADSWPSPWPRALVGFLVYNRPPARVYLGDGGSYLLGTALVVLLADAWAPGVPTPVGVAAWSWWPSRRPRWPSPSSAGSGAAVADGRRPGPSLRPAGRPGWPAPAASLPTSAIEAVSGRRRVLVAVHLVSMAAAVAVDAVGARPARGSATATGALTPDQEAAT